MAKEQEKKTEDAPVERGYFFPHPIPRTITASSKEEALKKLAEVEKADKIINN